MIDIVQEGHPVLRKKALPVPLEKIQTKEIKKIIQNMRKALASQEDGVAIAAPQIGVNLRIFVIAGKVFDEKFIRGEVLPKGYITTQPDIVYINPEIIKLSKKTKWLKEGCLSVRPLYGEVKRSLNVRIRAYDEKGHIFERGAGGLIAHIYQHETDHLNGILFIDSARNLHETNF